MKCVIADTGPRITILRPLTTGDMGSVPKIAFSAG